MPVPEPADVPADGRAHAAPAALAVRRSAELRDRDSNPKFVLQRHACCQLHHPGTRGQCSTQRPFPASMPRPARPSRGRAASTRRWAAISSSWVPCSTIRPCSSTTIRPGLADRRQAVGDDDRRAAGQQPAQALLDAALGVQVDVRGRLVEDQDPRVGDQRAGERDQLALAGRELHAALADLGVVALLGSASMNSSAPTARGGRAHLLVGRVGPPEGDVLADRAAEQEALLRARSPSASAATRA